MNTQEYELAFVEALPQNVRVVEPHTLDFSKNPAGALAFRYKHGWILINPLIPSRGLSGGGLARQHGHISGGHTTGHFIKGADGKISFKATNRYASKADWEKEVKAGAAGIAAKQAATKAAVQSAEAATNDAAKLESEGAPKAKVAAAHAEAAVAHQTAAGAFQAAGEGPAHKAGALTHSAHSAIHASKATKLEQAAKQEAAAKLEKRKALATQLSAKANDVTVTAKGSNGLPKDKAALHEEAAASHKAAQKANEAAGNVYVAEAHGKAAAKHEKIAANQLENHKTLEDAASLQSVKAAKASKSAHIAGEEGDSPVSQIAAHENAAKAHGQAATAHDNVGNTAVAQHHLKTGMAHAAEVGNLKHKQDEHEAATAANDKLKGDANAAYQKAVGMPETTPEEMQAKADALDGAAKKAGEALQHGGKHGLPHDALTGAKLTQSQGISKDLKGKIHEAKVQEQKAQAKLNQAAFNASDTAKAASLDAHASGAIKDHWTAHDEHQIAAEAAKAAGHGEDIQQFHQNQQQLHLNKIDKIHKEQGAAKKAEADVKKAAQDASNKAIHNSAALTDTSTHEQHLAAGSQHLDAAVAAQTAGMPNLAEYHKTEAKRYLTKAKELQANADTATAKKAAEIPKPPIQTASEDKPLKPVGELKDTGKVLGSHGSKVMVDEAGNKWLHKTDEYSRTLDPAVAALHRKVGLPTPIFVKTKEGHLQKLIPGSEDAFPGFHFDADTAAKMPPEDILKMLQHQVLDYATGNQDSHNGQWLKTPEHGLMSIDQGQAFKYAVGASNGDPYKGDGGKSKGDPLTTYGPNAHSAVYPALWKAAKDGKIQIPDPSGDNDFAKTIKALQDLPDEEFKRLFTPYAKQAFASGHKFPGGIKTEDDFLNAIVKHKNNISKDFQKLYDGLPQSAKASAPAAGLSAKEKALKALAEHEKANGDLAEGGKLEQAALAVGATKQEVTQAGAFPTKYLATLEVKSGGTPQGGGLSPKEKALKALAEHEDPAKDGAWTYDKATALEEVAKKAGASDEELKKSFKSPAAVVAELTAKEETGSANTTVSTGSSAGPDVSGSQKANALEALQIYAKSGKPLEPWMTKMAKDAGLSDAEIHAAASPAPAPGLSPKEEKLKALAEYSHNPPNDWSLKHYQALKQAAKDEGADAGELHTAMYDSKVLLDNLEKKAPAAPAPAAPAAPAKPTVDPFKPKAKWSKGIAGLHVNGEKEQHPVLAGPKGLVVHKKVGGTGWHVSSADGLTMGPKYKTQKEAKLAAEWMAKNHGAATITQDSHKEWSAANPEKLTEFKKGILHEQWNKDAQAELDKLGGQTPAAASAPSAPSPSAPVPAQAPKQLSAKELALKNLAEHNLPENGDDWTYDKDADLKDAASAAGASPSELGSATSKPKTYIKSLGVDPKAKPEKTYNGLAKNKTTDALMLKALYDQAHSPNATAAQKAAYQQAKTDWDAYYSKPFDPVKFATKTSYPQAPPAAPNKDEAGTAEAQIAHTKAQFTAAHDDGYIAATNGTDIGNGWKPTGAAKAAVYKYTGHAHEAINGQLRGYFDYDGNMTTPPVGPTGGSMAKVIADMDNAFRQAPPLDHDLVTIRKMGTNGQFPGFPPPMKKGEVYVDDAYGSTAKDKKAYTGTVWVEVRIPKGHKVIDANHASGSQFSHEQEVLLPRGAKYRVVSDQASPPDGTKPFQGNRYIVVEIIPTDEWN